MDATFDVNGNEFRVELSRFGLMKYFYNGNMIKKSFTWKFKDKLVHCTKDSKIQIDVSISSIKVLKNDELFIADLLPEIRTKFKPFSFKRLSILLLSALSLNAILWAFIIYFQ